MEEIKQEYLFGNDFRLSSLKKMKDRIDSVEFRTRESKYGAGKYDVVCGGALICKALSKSMAASLSEGMNSVVKTKCVALEELTKQLTNYISDQLGELM